MASPFDAHHRTHLRTAYTDTVPRGTTVGPAASPLTVRSRFTGYRA